MMYAPVKKLSRVNANLQQAMAAAERIFEMLDTHTEVRERPGARAAGAVPRGDRVPRRQLRLRRRVRRRRSCATCRSTCAAGQMVAIVGLSGAGKTTLVNLIPRFYDVTGGAILIDGVDIRDVTLASLRAQIGIVTQETVLFDDTIAANIAYGSPRRVARARSRRRRAPRTRTSSSSTLPDGYETRIGERGQRLSGGQRQRLAIARALLKNSPILILDEATSSLDAESELLVQDALANLMLQPHVVRHRAPAVDRAARRRDHRARARPDRRDRAATTSCWRGRAASTRSSTRCSCSTSRSATPEAAPSAADRQAADRAVR